MGEERGAVTARTQPWLCSVVATAADPAVDPGDHSNDNEAVVAVVAAAVAVVVELEHGPHIAEPPQQQRRIPAPDATANVDVGANAMETNPPELAIVVAMAAGVFVE